jgi:hypothetical protein
MVSGIILGFGLCLGVALALMFLRWLPVILVVAGCLVVLSLPALLFVVMELGMSWREGLAQSPERLLKAAGWGVLAVVGVFLFLWLESKIWPAKEVR